MSVTSLSDALNENPAFVCFDALAPAVAATETKKLALGHRRVAGSGRAAGRGGVAERVAHPGHAVFQRHRAVASPNAMPRRPSVAPYRLSTWHARAPAAVDAESEQMFRAYLRRGKRNGVERATGQARRGPGESRACRFSRNDGCGRRRAGTHLLGNAEVGLKLTSSASAPSEPQNTRARVARTRVASTSRRVCARASQWDAMESTVQNERRKSVVVVVIARPAPTTNPPPSRVLTPSRASRVRPVARRLADATFHSP